jgi:hypothetical protein
LPLSEHAVAESEHGTVKSADQLSHGAWLIGQTIMDQSSDVGRHSSLRGTRTLG